MLDPILNGIVLAIFAFIIGSVLQIFGLLNSGFSHDVLRRRVSRKQKGVKRPVSLRKWIKESKERAEASRVMMRTMPRSAKIAMTSFYGLIVILVLFVTFGPLEMKWLVFIPFTLAGFALMEWAFSLGKAGKIHVKRKAIFDIQTEDQNDN